MISRRIWLGTAAVAGALAAGGLLGLRAGPQKAVAATTAPAPEAPTPPGTVYRNAAGPESRRAYFGDLHEYTAATGWQAIPHDLTPRSAFAAACVNRKLYAIGGTSGGTGPEAQGIREGDGHCRRRSLRHGHWPGTRDAQGPGPRGPPLRAAAQFRRCE